MESEGPRLVGRRLRLAVLSVATLALVWACGLAPVTPVPDPTPANVGLSSVPTGTPIPTVSVALTQTVAAATPMAEGTSVPVSDLEFPCALDEASMNDPHKGHSLMRLAESYPEIYCEVAKRPWLRDPDNDPHHVEPVVLHLLDELATKNPASTLKVAKLPFLDTIDWGDANTMRFLTELYESDREGFHLLISNESATTGNPEKPFPLIYLELSDPDSAADIAALDWVQDGLHFQEHRAVTILQELAGVSRKTFRLLVESNWPRQPVKGGVEILAFEVLVDIAPIDEDAVIQIADMPFLGTVEYIDWQVVTRLHELGLENPDALDRILRDSTTRGGITDEQVFDILFLYLEQDAPAAAETIRSLPWVQDGITYVPPQDIVNPDAPPRELEPYFVMNMVNFAAASPDFLFEFAEKPWVQDGPDRIERSIVYNFRYFVPRDPQKALRVLQLPLLETIEEGDAFYVESLADLARKNRAGFEEAMARLAESGGALDN